MDINITLIGQMITFGIFVVFTMKFVWPHIISALHERENKISDGLAAAERGHKELALAQQKASEQLREAKAEAKNVLDEAHLRANQLIEEAKQKARAEGARMLEQAKSEISQEVNQAKRALHQQVASIAVASAAKILGRHVDEAANSDLIDQMIEEL